MPFHYFSFSDPKVIDSFLGISGTLWGVVGTLVLGILAIFGDQIKKYFFKPKIRGVEIIETWQENHEEALIYKRLIVKNIGKAPAKDVRAMLTYTDGGKLNFLPVPLNWTHWNTTTRDISQHEPAYLDIMCRQLSDSQYKFCWSLQVGQPLESDFIYFDTQMRNIRIEFYERDNKVGDVYMQYLIDRGKLLIKYK
ncbi:MAG: hypothetical protein WC735_01775 [Candidatus Paceibacterota bacterium]|jgi:hypothetical protein